MRLIAVVLIQTLWFASISVAQSVAPIDTLYRALGLPEILAIMREEGMGYGLEIQSDLLEGRGGEEWPAIVNDIYWLERMQNTVRNRLDSELAANDLAPMIAFFTSPMGEKIVSLEVSGRRALLDESIEDASKEAAAKLLEDEGKRLELLDDFMIAADLVESNVVGALNSNFAFYQGLASGGALPEDMTDAEILADVWSQEEDIRVDTKEWLYSYLLLAYQPLEDDELQQYTLPPFKISGSDLTFV